MCIAHLESYVIEIYSLGNIKGNSDVLRKSINKKLDETPQSVELKCDSEHCFVLEVSSHVFINFTFIHIPK